jgi:hypothetical protein
MGGTRKFVTLAACVVAVAGVSASTALAGEVKGPPGDPNDPQQSMNYTAGPEHANSFCVFSGLNDMDTSDPNGQTSKITQTPADGPAGAPGQGLDVGGGFVISCRGGSNLERGSEG